MAILVDPSGTIPGAASPARFLGFTLDCDQFEGGPGENCLDELRDPRVRALCAQLAPRSIRFGGAGVEHLRFVEHDPAGRAASGPFRFTFDREKADALGDFARACAAPLMLSLPARFADLENAAALAADFIDRRRDEVPWLEIGNEPDWGWASQSPDYPARVLAFRHALAPRFPGCEWVAGYGGRSMPYGVCNPDSATYLDFARRAGEAVDLFSVHYYAGSSTKPYASRDWLLSPRAADIGQNRVAELRQLLELAGRPPRIAVNEFNTFAGKGLADVSDSAAAAVWLADAIGSLARSGVEHAHVQCGFARRHGDQDFWRYALVDTRGPAPVVRPHYLAFYLWTRLMGELQLPVHGALHPVNAHATRHADGGLRILVLNRDDRHPRPVSLRALDAAFADAETLAVEHGGPAAKTARLGGIDPTDTPLEAASWRGLAARRGRLEFVLPPCGLVLLRVRVQ